MLEHPVTSETPPPLPFKGSVFVLMLESRDRVMQLLMDDPYAHNNVWDWTAAVISPVSFPSSPPYPVLDTEHHTEYTRKLPWWMGNVRPSTPGLTTYHQQPPNSSKAQLPLRAS